MSSKSLAKFLPNPTTDEEEYKKLLWRYQVLSFSDEIPSQEFKCCYPIREGFQSPHVFKINDVPALKFSVQVQFYCPNGSNLMDDHFKPHPTWHDRCHCGSFSSVRIVVIKCGIGSWNGNITFSSSKGKKEFAWLKNKTIKKSNSEELLYSFNYGDHDSLFENGNLAFDCKLETAKCRALKYTFDLSIKAWESAWEGRSGKISEQFSDRNIGAEAPDHLTDVTLCVEGTRIHVHKLILSMKSRYFKGMFASGMKESHEKVVELKNVDLKTMKVLLEFIYDKYIDNEEITVQILVASHHYRIPCLTKICKAELSQRMSTDNVIEIWTTSMACSMRILAHYSVIFMARNWKEMIRDGKIQEEENFVQLNNTICFLHSEEM